MDFYSRVALVCRAIPPGRVATYGQIAALCGRPRWARQVGFALNRGCREPVPAHRVVNRQGVLSGAAAFLVPDLQRVLLEAEGVPVDDRQTVDLRRFGWRPTEEEQARLGRLLDDESEEAPLGGL